MASDLFVQVAIATPLYTCFDYRLPSSSKEGFEHADSQTLVGCRVRVPFGRREVTGVIMAVSEHSTVPANKLRHVLTVIDTEPVLQKPILDLLNWAAQYYAHPVGEVVHTALPANLRAGKPSQPKQPLCWHIAEGVDIGEASASLKRAPKQLQVFQLIAQQPDEPVAGLSEDRLDELNPNWRTAMKALRDKQLVEAKEAPVTLTPQLEPSPVPELNDEQSEVLQSLLESSSDKTVSGHLLYGITGSGKTEVYLGVSQQALQNNQQVLLLVPEIGLTPQLTDRFTRRLQVPTVVIHSGLSDGQRHAAWYEAATGRARLVIGTRSSIFTPMPELGLIIVDEEHDSSYKQQDNFRYHARDLALVRAQLETSQTIKVILGSATPSLESMHNAMQSRYRLHRLKQRAGTAQLPQLKLADLRKQKLNEGVCDELLMHVDQHLKAGNQVLLFLNRRGYSPLLMCHECGWTTQCQRCDAHMTYHKQHHLLRCHHCGAEARRPTACPDCSSEELISIGTGTERVSDMLAARFPDTEINRIDRDTTRRKGELAEKLQQAHDSGKGILLGTQMLAKGHDFPNVTLVGILDADQALYSNDFRATEHLAQLIIQVAGRAGRANKQGEVFIQTHHPDHPLLQTLLHKGYDAFASEALEERQLASLPPYSYLALLRTESVKQEQGRTFLNEARNLFAAYQSDEIELFGPLQAPMEKRAGRFRYQLMIQSRNRRALLSCLRQGAAQLGKLKTARTVRWSLDVDPCDTF